MIYSYICNIIEAKDKINYLAVHHRSLVEPPPRGGARIPRSGNRRLFLQVLGLVCALAQSIALTPRVISRSEVSQSRLGHAQNGLSQLRDVTSKPEFICGLLRGLGGNLPVAIRVDFAKVSISAVITAANQAQEVFAWMHESAPDPRRPLDVQCEDGRISLIKAMYQDDRFCCLLCNS